MTIDGQAWERVPLMNRDARIRVIKKMRTEIKPAGRGEFWVRLVIDQQSFTLDMPKPKREAEFHCKMLAIALNRFKYGD